jgi:hypothetical protein
MRILEVENLQKAVSGSKEGQRTRCPQCNKIMDSDFRGKYFLCSKCQDVYLASEPSGLEKITVEPAEDLSSYPEVTLIAHPPFCDCELKEYIKTLISSVGPEYCPRHNIITLGGICSPKEIQNFEKKIEFILIHETLHWLCGKFLGESASFWPDINSVYESLEDFFESDEKTE